MLSDSYRYLSSRPPINGSQRFCQSEAKAKFVGSNDEPGDIYKKVPEYPTALLGG